MEHLDERPAMTSEERRSLPARARGLVLANWRIVLSAACLGVFLLLLEDVLAEESLRIDRLAYRAIVEGLRTSALTPVMEGFSALATPVVLVVLLLAIAAFAPGRRTVWCCTVNLVLVSLLNAALKLLVQRPRPEGFRLAEASGYSFPSGHSMVAMAFFGLVIWLIWRYEPDRRRRDLLAAAFGVVILMIGISRIYLGVHYASDVVGGFCVSLIWLALYTRIAVPLFLA